MRAYDLGKVDSAMHNVYDAKIANPLVNWRYLIFPSTPLPLNPTLAWTQNYSFLLFARFS